MGAPETYALIGGAFVAGVVLTTIAATLVARDEYAVVASKNALCSASRAMRLIIDVANDGGKVAVRRLRGDDRPITGTQLIRQYQGTDHVVTVTHDAFEYQGRPYKSLSAIARHITGTRWNGRTFFGLRPSRGAA